VIREIVVAIAAAVVLYAGYLAGTPVVNGILVDLFNQSVSAGEVSTQAQDTFNTVKLLWNFAYIMLSAAIIVFLVAATQRREPVQEVLYR